MKAGLSAFDSPTPPGRLWKEAGEPGLHAVCDDDLAVRKVHELVYHAAFKHVLDLPAFGNALVGELDSGTL